MEMGISLPLSLFPSISIEDLASGFLEFFYYDARLIATIFTFDFIGKD